MSASPAVRYFPVPKDITISIGVGWLLRKTAADGSPEIVDGGVVSFAKFFMTTVLGKLASANNEDAEEFLTTRLRKCVAGDHIEIPEAFHAALVGALPIHLAQANPELYDELRPFIRAVRTAPTSKPEGWDVPANDPTPPEAAPEEAAA